MYKIYKKYIIRETIETEIEIYKNPVRNITKSRTKATVSFQSTIL